MGKRRKHKKYAAPAPVKVGGKPGYAYTPCAATHPPLPIKTSDGKTFKVYGGSCLHPYVKDADVYIGLDTGMAMTNQSYPWTPGYEVFYKITDMSVPKDPETFKQLIDWTEARVRAGDKVHIGCIGGHGRTGMVLAALYAQMTGRKNKAIQEVRAAYCDSAVESSEQVTFLQTHFGIGHASPAKDWGAYGNYGNYGNYDAYGSKGATKGLGVVSSTFDGEYTSPPVKDLENIFGDWALTP